MSSEKGVYVYGVTRVTDVLAPKMDGIRRGEPVFFINLEGLRAVVSWVPLAELVGQALQEQVRDSGWLEEKVRRHHGVVQAVMNAQAILPFKFGVVFRSEAKVIEMLQSKQTGFLSGLEAVEGKEEYGVEFRYDAGVVRQYILGKERSLADLHKELKKEPPGKAYLLKRRIEASLGDRVKVEAGNWVDEALERLGSYISSSDSRVARSAGGSQDLVLEGRSYLVGREKREDFVAELRVIEASLRKKGLSVEVTGPWPPYSFASQVDGSAV